jgi:hypothetical protein
MNADVFVCGDSSESGAEATVRPAHFRWGTVPPCACVRVCVYWCLTCHLQVRRVVPAHHLVDVHLEPQWSAEQIVEAFQAATAGSALHDVAQSGAKHALSAGNLLGLRWVEMCYRRVQALERDKGFSYKYIHFQRPDMEW